LTESNPKRWFFLGTLPFDNKEVNIPLLKILWASTTQSSGSVQHLEYSIAEALNKITKNKQRKSLS
jgi:hypothetical protein